MTSSSSSTRSRTVVQSLAVTVAVLAVAFNVGTAVGQVVIDNSTYRIGLSFDGNYFDKDDIGAAPMAQALIAEAGLTDWLTHLDYNSEVGLNDSSQEQQMIDSVNGAASRWGISSSVLFNDQSDLSGAIANIAAQINASSADDRFYFSVGGPMEVAWRGISASDPAKRQYTTVISHHPFNENRTNPPEMTHDWGDIKASGVQTIEISDQNLNDFKSPLDKWDWLENSSDADERWLYSRNQKGSFDVSDAGMTWYTITGRGDQNGQVADVQDLFNGNFSYTNGGPTPPPAPPGDGGLVAHYKFDETGGSTTYEEVSGTAVSLSGNPGFVSGKVQNAIDLDGSGDYIVAPVPSGLDSSELTVAFWTKFASGAADWGAWWSAQEPGDGRLALEVHGYAPDNGPYVNDMSWPSASEPSGRSNLADGQYHLIALTLSESGDAVKIYVDGVEEDRRAWSSTATIEDMILGARRKWADGPIAFEFAGEIDDMQIYDGALSASDVSWLYDNPGSVIPEPTTVALLGLGGLLILRQAKATVGGLLRFLLLCGG